MRTQSRHIAALLIVITMFGFVVSCSDDSNPAKSTTPSSTATTVWDADSSAWISVVNATSATGYALYSFTTKDTVAGGVPKLTEADGAANWDLALRKREANTNSGAFSSSGGTVLGIDLGVVNFAAVTLADTVGKTWKSDYLFRQIGEWYSYDMINHVVTMTRKVFVMADATGQHYVKFRIDSISGATGPTDMGTVYLTYYYNPSAADKNLPGPTVHTSVVVGTSTAYFDFSTGTTVTPADPAQSVEWDISFHNYAISQNDGPNGIGLCAEYDAFTQMSDPTDIESMTAIPAEWPLRLDGFKSVLSDWSSYDFVNHVVYSNNKVYLVKSGTAVYKMKFTGYFKNVSGTAVDGYPTFMWKQL